MNNSDTSASRLSATSSLSDLCINNSANSIEQCNTMKTVELLLKAHEYISQIFYPSTIIFIVIGTILNLFSMFCFLKTNKRSSQNVYLSALSLGDTINLHVNFALPMLRKFDYIDNQFRNSIWSCRLSGVLREFFFIFPTWIVVLLTFERFIGLSGRTKRRSSPTQLRPIISIVILIVIVLCLSLYRIRDLKGIDQLSVFSIVACNGEDHPMERMRNFNLMIWTIVPECLTFIMSLIIIYQIRYIANHVKSNHAKACQSRYNQATRTVLLISILFLIFHTPTGITIALHLFYSSEEATIGIIVILVSRKLTMLLYEINLSCKFFIYNQTFRNFKGILCTSMFQFIRRADSARLGRPVLVNTLGCPYHPTVHFNSRKQSITSPVSQSDSYVRNSEEHHNLLNNRQRRTSREQQPLTAAMTKTNDDTQITLLRRSDLSRKYSKEQK